MESNSIGATAPLTYKEAVAIIKSMIAYNGGTVQFNEDYLKYAGELELHVSREDQVMTLMSKLPRNMG